MQFIQQAGGQQLANDGDRSAHRDIRCAWFALQRGDGLGEVTSPTKPS
jgi:hypothetical protein